MPDCPDPIRLSAYLDDQLPADQAQEIARHLETCPTCSDQLQTWRQLGRLLRHYPWPPLNKPALRQRICLDDWQYETTTIHLVGTLSAVAAVILLAVGLWSALEQPTSASSDPAALWEIAALEPTAAENPETGLAAWIMRDLSKDTHP